MSVGKVGARMKTASRHALAIGCAFALCAAPSASAAPPESGPRRYQTQLGNIEAAVDQLAKAYTNPTAMLRKFPNQRRIIDARVFFELGQFENAAMLLFDVIERPDFKGDLEYEASQLLLGECLLKMDNSQAARELFLQVASGRDAQLAEEARLFLLELALDDGSDAVLQRAVAELGLYKDEADGLLGPKTRSALRLFQQQQALPADGHPTQESVRRLQAVR